MAEDRMAVLDMLRKATADGNVDILRDGVRVLSEIVETTGGYPYFLQFFGAYICRSSSPSGRYPARITWRSLVRIAWPGRCSMRASSSRPSSPRRASPSWPGPSAAASSAARC